ncbi:hypothetical protein BJ878DRAFT_281804 [Calycina marina]|uniref:Uncharacterized protein n=1 Tax=Calycina marina TaxID=1763456 RepID=A0A9P7YVK8_9HELO|nr:hypothetical protein BJ878DRAFT_281804 [Calycina marina]
MATSIPELLARGINSTSDYGTIAQVQANTTSGTNSSQTTLYLIQDLMFAQSKSVRTSTIILATSSVLAAFATAASILYDCYWASKRCNPKFKASKFCVSSIHPAETFPLILSIGIILQGLLFAGAQGKGMDSLFIKGCAALAQFVWPALFIVPYLQTVFGLECALRSLRKLPFQARGKYDVTICTVAVVLMTVGTWIVSFLDPEPDTCFASLVWYVSAFGLEGLVAMSICAGLMLISAVTIFVRLLFVNMIDQHQRIAASRMVYYLILGILSLAFTIPYFISQTVGNGDLKADMIATVVLNLSGLMNGLLQLFLRSNTATSSFGSKNGRTWNIKKHQIRMFGPNELAFNNLMADPVSGPRGGIPVSTSQTNLVGYEKEQVTNMESTRSPPFNRAPIKYNPLKYNPFTSNATAFGQAATGPIYELPSDPVSSPQRGHEQKQSYHLFPNRPDGNSRQETTSVYDISDLLAPPDIFGGKSRHRRDSSVVSSATVQIGLRLSNFVMAPSQADMNMLSLPSTAYNANSARSTPPLQIQTNVRPMSPQNAPQNFPFLPNLLNIGVKFPTPCEATSAIYIDKILPPTPVNTNSYMSPPLTAIPRTSQQEGEAASAPVQLSPTVYSPSSSKLPARSNLSREPPQITENMADWI